MIARVLAAAWWARRLRFSLWVASHAHARGDIAAKWLRDRAARERRGERG